MTTLTAEQHEEVERAGDDPVRVEVLITREPYVILRATVYEKLGQMVEVEKVDPSFFEYGEFIPQAMTRILYRLPYHAKADAAEFPRWGLVQIREDQIVLWFRLRSWHFLLTLDPGHSHNFSIPDRLLKRWAGVESLEPIGEIQVNRQLMTHFQAQGWILMFRSRVSVSRQQTSIATRGCDPENSHINAPPPSQVHRGTAAQRHPRRPVG